MTAHPSIAGIPLVGSPVRMDGARADSDLPPPALGQHTGEVLQRLGLGRSDIDELVAAKVITC